MQVKCRVSLTIYLEHTEEKVYAIFHVGHIQVTQHEHLVTIGILK